MDLLGSSTGSKYRGNAAIHTSPPLLTAKKKKKKKKNSTKETNEKRTRNTGNKTERKSQHCSHHEEVKRIQRAFGLGAQLRKPLSFQIHVNDETRCQHPKSAERYCLPWMWSHGNAKQYYVPRSRMFALFWNELHSKTFSYCSVPGRFMYESRPSVCNRTTNPFVLLLYKMQVLFFFRGGGGSPVSR